MRTFKHGGASITVRPLSTGWDKNNYMRLYYELLTNVAKSDNPQVANMANSYIELYCNAVLFTCSIEGLEGFTLLPAGASVADHIHGIDAFMNLPFTLLELWAQELNGVNEALLNDRELFPSSALEADEKKD